MNRLKELRLNANLTQAELAKAADTTQRNISYWESGHIELNLYAALKLAQIFQVNVEYLAGYSDEFDIKPELNYAAPTGDSLYTAEERKLIENYRQLSFYKQELIRNNIKAMLPAEAESKQKKKV